MNEHFKNIIDDGMAVLIDARKKAEDAVAKAKRDMGVLAELSESLPHRILDKASLFFIGEMNFHGEEHRLDEAYISIAGKQEHFLTYNSPRKLPPMKGRYRVIVMLEKMD